jgi:hypothetical protein
MFPFRTGISRLPTVIRRVRKLEFAGKNGELSLKKRNIALVDCDIPVADSKKPRFSARGRGRR